MRPIFLSFLSICFWLGCSDSPLFNHKNAEDLQKEQGGAGGAGSGAGGGSGATGRQGACPLFFEKTKLCASVPWIREPAGAGQEGEFKITFWDKNQSSEAGPYVDLGTRKIWVDVHLWMPEHGHGSFAKTKVRITRDPQGVAVVGVYQASHVIFSMEGLWEVTVQLKKGDAAQQDLQDQGNHANDIILDQAKWTYRVRP